MRHVVQIRQQSFQSRWNVSRHVLSDCLEHSRNLIGCVRAKTSVHLTRLCVGLEPPIVDNTKLVASSTNGPEEVRFLCRGDGLQGTIG